MRRRPIARTEESRLEFAASNGLLDRRYFVKYSTFAPAAFLAGPAFSQSVGSDQPDSVLYPGSDTEEYGSPSSFERARVKRLVPTAGKGRPVRTGGFAPLHLLQGTLTPNSLHFEVNHHGVPEINPDQHTLVIHGMVKRPLKYTVDVLENYAFVTRSLFIECSGNSSLLWRNTPVDAHIGLTHGLISASEWTGVALGALLDECGASDEAEWVIAEGGDAGAMTRSIPIASARQSSMIALYQNGERLRPGQGYPMRLLTPGFEGSANIKWIRSLYVTNRPAMSRSETSRYTDLMPDGKAMQFSLVMGVKSVITRPSNVWPLSRFGVYEISGLAWSGRGRIARVEVSADGGQTWADAMLEEPVRSMMLTQFRIPWAWRGAPAVLQSRATDEHGHVQPTRDALIAAKGRHAEYHYNAIHSWAVSPDGAIVHVFA